MCEDDSAVMRGVVRIMNDDELGGRKMRRSGVVDNIKKDVLRTRLAATFALYIVLELVF